MIERSIKTLFDQPFDQPGPFEVTRLLVMLLDQDGPHARWHSERIAAGADTCDVTMMTPPTRRDVAMRWRAVARGEVEREVVSAWAVPLMFADYETQPDPMVMTALQHLHGFDMTRSEDGRLIRHGPPGPYLHDCAHIAAELERWLTSCQEYDADPVAWRAQKRREAQEAIRRERGDA